MNGTEGTDAAFETPDATSSGVEALIRRLREQGVAAGNAAREEIIAAAEKEATRIVKEARQKAEAIVEEAKEEVDRLRRAGEDALQIAGRDSVLHMREIIMNFFEDRVRRLASTELEDAELLRQLIVEVARRVRDDAAVPDAQEIEVVLPREVLGIKELRDKPEELEGKLSRFAKEIATATWREGVTIDTMEPGGRGIKVHLKEDNLEIDLTDEAIAELILEHLRPRFHAVLMGMVGK